MEIEKLKEEKSLLKALEEKDSKAIKDIEERVEKGEVVRLF